MDQAESKPRVLLVDDDEDFLFQHRIQLENAGFEVATAGSRGEAEEKTNAFTSGPRHPRPDDGAPRRRLRAVAPSEAAVPRPAGHPRHRRDERDRPGVRPGVAGRASVDRRGRPARQADSLRATAAGNRQAPRPSDRQPSTVNRRRSTLNGTLNAQRSTVDAQPLDAQRSTLNAQRSTLNAQRSTVNAQGSHAQRNPSYPRRGRRDRHAPGHRARAQHLPGPPRATRRTAPPASRCKTAETGEEALEKIGQRVPDILLLDLKLPGISGLDVLEGGQRARAADADGDDHRLRDARDGDRRHQARRVRLPAQAVHPRRTARGCPPRGEAPRGAAAGAPAGRGEAPGPLPVHLGARPRAEGAAGGDRGLPADPARRVGRQRSGGAGADRRAGARSRRAACVG